MRQSAQDEVRTVLHPFRASCRERTLLDFIEARTCLRRISEYELTRPQQLLPRDALVRVVGIGRDGEATNTRLRDAVAKIEVFVTGLIDSRVAVFNVTHHCAVATCENWTMRVVRNLLIGAAAFVFVTACSDADPRSETAYCGQIANHLSDLNSPVIETSLDIGRVLAAWRSVAKAAPVAIEPEWKTMVDAMQTAVTVDTQDPESMQKVADTARESEPAAKRVASYTQERCGLTIGVAP